MDNITEDEIHGIIAYGIKLRNSLHTYFFESIGYKASSAIVDKVLEEYHRQIDKFIEEEDKVLGQGLLPRKNEVSEDIRAVSSLSPDEYAELIDINHELYSRRIQEFCSMANLESIAEKQMQWCKRNKGRTDHFCTDTGETRTFYDYNINLFVLDRNRLAAEIRSCLDITDEDLPVYIHDFDGFADDYSSIIDLMKKTVPY